MPRRLIVISLGLLLLIWGTTFTGEDKQFSVSVLENPVELSYLPLSNQRAACSIQKHDDTVLGFFSGFDPGDKIVTYFDMAGECGSPAYPFEIQSVSFPLLDAGGYQWPVSIDIVVYDLLGADSCSGPGAERCRFTVTCDSATFRLPHVGTATFPQPCCVSGPVFIGIEYSDNGAGPFPSITFDKSAPVPGCDNWGYGVEGWAEWFDFWTGPNFPGYPVLWVDGETESGACAGRVVINEINSAPGEVGRTFPLLEQEWVEIYNAGGDGVDLTGWTISNNDGTTAITLPSWILPAGSFLTLHQGAGTDDSDFDDLDGHYYTGSVTEIFDNTEDECALYSSAPGPANIIDFVAWTNDGSFTPGLAHAMAVGGGIWTGGDYLASDASEEVSCIARYFDGFDRDISDDWQNVLWTQYAQNRALQPENAIQIAPKNRAVLSNSMPTFEWSDFADADDYSLQVDNNWDFSSPEINVTGLTANSYTPGTALSDNAYFWRVRATVGGSPTPWAAEWLLVIETSRALQGESGQMPAPHKWQRKDTKLLCLWEQQRSRRPGCVETGNHAWDVAHPDAAPPGCGHDDNYCARASIAMVNAHYGGDLSQDRISYHVCENFRAAPEGDYGHNVGLSDARVTTGLSWALNGAAINYMLVASGGFTFAQIKGWVDQLDCFVAAVPGHCLVIDDYLEIAIPGPQGYNIQIVYSQDPWRGPNDPSVFSFVLAGAPQVFARRHRNNAFDAVWLQPAAGVTARMQEATVTTDTDGDGIMDFDEQNPRNLHSLHTDSDTDDDEVEDKNEIRNYTFHDQAGHHAGHENDALTFPDVDGDNLRAENDCDSDNDSDFDGGEDINGDGFNPVSTAGHMCTRETCQFDNAEFCISVAVDKDTYLLGEPVYIVDNHFARQTHTYHANSLYNYEKGPLCPVKADGSGLAHNGSFTTDGGGHARRTLVEYCLSPGVKYLTVDVLDDNLYSTPDNLDPQTCWECEIDWFHGFHWANDYPYHNVGITYPNYPYPVICINESNPTLISYVIECPWWWWCYVWPPIPDRYWLAIEIDRALIDNGVVEITQPPTFVQGTPDCLPPPLQQFQFDEGLTFGLEGNSQNPEKQWLAFSTQFWQLPDSMISTRIVLNIPVGTKLASTPYVKIMAGDSAFGWSPTPYDSIPISVVTSCCVGSRGDVNGDGSVNPNILDLNFLVNYIFRLSGNPGPCPEESDVNGSGGNPNILDLNVLVNYIFRFGPPPGSCP